ncbi:MAG: RuBisCO large subunit C-terminal-like domain-containing protein [Actinomycetota bacterium]|nr:RuBisCO large subunit C-terminal-like domain-containing protein [Actinomycetota bacterium]
MLEPTALTVSGERLRAVYEFTGPIADARGRAEALRVEQTIEFPADLVPDDDIQHEIVGRIESFDEVGAETVRVEVSYAIETTGYEFPQLLNVLFGNSSLLPGVKLVDVTVPRTLSESLGGPRFGIDGLREMFDAPERPLLATALKPMGFSPERFADLTYELALGGIDMIKDDHSLANQPFAEFEARVRACSDAVKRANEQTGFTSVYMPSINAPHRLLDERVEIAVEAGAGGLLILPGITGFDFMRDVATRDDVAIPIMGHPAFLGGFHSSPSGGISHDVLYGILMRYAGADLSIFPNYGGRFSFSEGECTAIATACKAPMAGIRPIMPAPGGGMTMDRIGEIVEFYGNDVALLIGGDLHRGGSLKGNAQAFRTAIE